MGEEIMFQALIENHFLFVDDLLHEGANILETNSRKESMFLVAAKHGKVPAYA